MKTVNILGTEYTIDFVKIEETDELKDNGWSGLCNDVLKKILVADCTEQLYYGKMEDEDRECTKKHILRHEILHAFMNESGLRGDSGSTESWATNETMIDYFAIQFPKIIKAFREADAL